MLSFFTHTKKGVLISFILFALFFSQCVKLNNDEPLVDNEPVGSTTTPSTESEVTGENTSSNTSSETTNVESPTTERQPRPPLLRREEMLFLQRTLLC